MAKLYKDPKYALYCLWNAPRRLKLLFGSAESDLLYNALPAQFPATKKAKKNLAIACQFGQIYGTMY